jgi:membrane-associated phospholipid phosphatase
MGGQDTAIRKILFFCLLTGIIIAVGDFKILSFFKSNAWVLKGDVYYLLRIGGSMWTWLLISISIALAFPRSDSPSPLKLRVERGSVSLKIAAISICLSAGLGGLIAEFLKLIIRRERPIDQEVYVFRAFSERAWSTSGLGLPSSHAAVAFGGSLALITIFPTLRWPALGMAIGCGFTRISSGAHYPTDVAAGALVGFFANYLAGLWLRRESWKHNRTSK